MPRAHGTKPIKVYDPENGSGYTLRLMAGDEGEIKYTAGVRAYFDCPSKRVFLCKKYQRGQCTRGAECISIHADRNVVAELRERTPKKKWVQVAFTLEAEGKEFTVPYERTERTVGRDMLMAAKETHGVLCEAHDTATCPDGEKCKKIHVTGSHMRHVRNMWRLPCCRGCVTGRLLKSMGHIPAMGLTVGGVHYVADELASTKGLRELSAGKDTAVMLPPNKVCRPHLRQQCKWGDHCNNVHICRKRYRFTPENTDSSDSNSSSSQPAIDNDDEELPELLDDDEPIASPLASPPTTPSPAASPVSHEVSPSMVPVVMPVYPQQYLPFVFPVGSPCRVNPTTPTFIPPLVPSFCTVPFPQ